MRTSILSNAIAGAVCALMLSAPGAFAQGQPAKSPTLDKIQKAGTLNCGVNPGLAGFSMPDDKGLWLGIDVDLCRAVAAAIFNDPTKVKFIPMTAKDRFTALQTGEIDILARNGTWTMQRETELGLLFTATNYYDGQGFMVRKKLNVTSALELSQASICVQQGTTTELNLADFFRANNMKYEVIAFATSNEAVKAYDSGRCDAFTTDASGLYAERVKLANANDHVVLSEIISKEPLGPAVRQGDDIWFNIVKWAHFAMVNAEELGVNKGNADEQAKSIKPDVRRLLGVENEFGKFLGLSNDWAMRIIKHVGNYGESFERNIGAGSRLRIDRGVNKLWNKGGIMYAPPIR